MTARRRSGSPTVCEAMPRNEPEELARHRDASAEPRNAKWPGGASPVLFSCGVGVDLPQRFDNSLLTQRNQILCSSCFGFIPQMLCPHRACLGGRMSDGYRIKESRTNPHRACVGGFMPDRYTIEPSSKTRRSLDIRHPATETSSVGVVGGVECWVAVRRSATEASSVGNLGGVSLGVRQSTVTAPRGRLRGCSQITLGISGAAVPAAESRRSRTILEENSRDTIKSTQPWHGPCDADNRRCRRPGSRRSGPNGLSPTSSNTTTTPRNGGRSRGPGCAPRMWRWP